MSITAKQHVDYWLKLSSESLADMKAALKSGRRSNAMFCGHLAIEKMLKALCAAQRVPIIKEHKLLKLSYKAGLALTVDQETELGTITNFNIAARYDDYKLRFHQLCTPKYTALWASKIEAWYKYLKPIVIQERSKLPNNSPI